MQNLNQVESPEGYKSEKKDGEKRERDELRGVRQNWWKIKIEYYSLPCYRPPPACVSQWRNHLTQWWSPPSSGQRKKANLNIQILCKCMSSILYFMLQRLLKHHIPKYSSAVQKHEAYANFKIATQICCQRHLFCELYFLIYTSYVQLKVPLFWVHVYINALWTESEGFRFKMNKNSTRDNRLKCYSKKRHIKGGRIMSTWKV